MDINARIAARVSFLRKERDLSLDALAYKSDVSRSMISLIERGQSSATAVVLEKLAAGLGVTLASLFEESAASGGPLVRRSEQLEWRDPQSGYVRRNVSPPNAQSPMQIVDVSFPAGAAVAYETTERDRSVHQQIWILEGKIDITVGADTYSLEPGDCLAFRLDRPTAFHNPHRKPARYMVAITTDTLRS
ncbi:helix-turn-helix domain-containing protein [Collimonas sp. NPDC087041]|uniref:helix-turn-helix domain-containing protein n=1 Tax=Collimonas sp. NPDC087041 TaxID=3363960 RepID=UPI0038124298